jgi:hypothetical protein
MTRRFNYTGRARITTDHFTARQISDNPLTASITLDLAALDLPAGAEVIVEPYAGTVSQRVPCGRIGALVVPRTVDLTSLATGNSIHFRVKVVAADGKLAAAANRLRLLGRDEDSGRRSLLPVETTPELGEEVWRVQVNTNLAPRLQLNSRVPSIEKRLLDDPLLSGAILVPAVRQILEVLAETLDGDIWQPDWLAFALRWAPDIDPEKELDEEERRELVDLVVSGFAKEQAFVRSLIIKSGASDQ